MKKFAPYLVLAIIIGLGVLVWQRGEKPAVVVQNTEQVQIEGVTTPPGKKPESGMATLAALSQKGESLECQVVLERSDAEGNIEGTYFTHQGSMRGDFMVPSPEFGGKLMSSMIVDANMLFVWTTIDNQVIGFKSDLTNLDTTVSTKEPIPLDEPVRYTCTVWDSVDGSVFIPPAQVTFTDTRTAIQGGIEYGILPD